jgi:hypothetical protein
MGNNFATDLASGEFVTSLEQQIAIHFASNCYPPIPQFMVDVAVKAIQLVNSDEGNSFIELPAGVSFRNAKEVTAINAVDSLRLEAWIGE